MKVVAAALLSAMAVGMADAADSKKYYPLENPGKNQCIQVSNYNDATDQYKLKFGACKGNKRTLGFRHEGQGKALRTKDSYCLSTTTASSKSNVEIILTDCPKKLGNGQKWTKVGRNQWRSGYGKCLDYSGSKFVQKPCKTLSSDDEKSLQQYVFLKSTTPATPSILCANWLKKFQCPSSAVPVNNPSGLICLGATDYACNQVCCRSPTTCGNFAISCPTGYAYNKVRRCGNAGEPSCSRSTCCDSTGPQKCGNSGVTCPYGSKLDYSQPCGTSAYGACTSKTCCYPNKVTTCKSANYQCNYGSVLLPNVACNTPGYPSCKESICCRAPSAPNTCATVNFRCNYGEKRNNFQRCNNNGDPACSRSVCCTAPPKSNTCASVNFKCNYNEKRNDNIKCNNEGDPGCTRSICCVAPAPPSQEYCGKANPTGCPSGYTSLDQKPCGGAGQGSCVAANCCQKKTTVPPTTKPTTTAPTTKPTTTAPTTKPTDPTTTDPTEPTGTTSCATAKCSGNQVLISEPDSETDLSKCCTDDTCNLWGDRIPSDNESQTNKDFYCTAAEYNGFISPDQRDDNCQDNNGDLVKCTPKLCCISAEPTPSSPEPDQTGNGDTTATD